MAPTAWLAKVRLPGETLATAAVPVPVRLMVCGLPVALSVRVTAAVKEPLAAGVKVTLTVQLAPAATLAPQVLVWAKLPALAPVSAWLVRVYAALPVLFTVLA